MTHIKTSPVTQPALFMTPERVMLDLHLAFLPTAGMSKAQIGERFVDQLMQRNRGMEPLEFFSVIARTAESEPVRAQARQGLACLMNPGDDLHRYDFTRFPSHHHTPVEVGEEVARVASGASSFEFKEASIQMLGHTRNRPELDAPRLKVMLAAQRWPYKVLVEAAQGNLMVRDRYHHEFTLWKLDHPPEVTAPVQARLDWLQRTCPSQDHGEFDPTRPIRK